MSTEPFDPPEDLETPSGPVRIVFTDPNATVWSTPPYEKLPPSTSYGNVEVPDPATLEVVGARVVIVNEWGQPVEVVPCEDFRVTIEENRVPTRTIDIDMPGDEQWAPERYYEHLDPRAYTLIRAEVLRSDGEFEAWTSLAVGVVTDDSFSRSPSEYNFTVSCPDRSSAPWWPLEGGIAIETGTALEEVCRQILSITRTPVVLNIGTPTGVFFPACVIGQVGDHPWALVSDLARSMGATTFFDAEGRPWISKMVDASTTDPIRTYTPKIGSRSDLVSLQRALSIQDSYDGVIVPWREGRLLYPDTFIFRPGLWDGDASLLVTEEDARKAGAAFMLEHEGVQEVPTITITFAPEVDIGQVVEIQDRALGHERSVKSRVTGVAHSPKQGLTELRVAAVRTVAS